MTTAERQRFAKPNFLAKCQRQLDKIIALAELDDADERDVIEGLLADAEVIARVRLRKWREGDRTGDPDFPDDV